MVNSIQFLLSFNLRRYTKVEEAFKNGQVDPNIQDKFGNTVLAVATQNNRKRIVKVAVRAGVLLDAQNAQGQTAGS